MWESLAQRPYSPLQGRAEKWGGWGCSWVAGEHKGPWDRAGARREQEEHKILCSNCRKRRSQVRKGCLEELTPASCFWADEWLLFPTWQIIGPEVKKLAYDYRARKQKWAKERRTGLFLTDLSETNFEGMDKNRESDWNICVTEVTGFNWKKNSGKRKGKPNVCMTFHRCWFKFEV